VSAKGHGPVRRRLNREQRRTTLLDAAADVAMERGLDHVTMERVSAVAGVDKRVAYRFFANRDELLVALFERENAWLDDQVVEVVAAHRSLAEQLRGIVGLYFAARDANRLHTHNTAAAGLSGPLVRYQDARTERVLDYFVQLLGSHGPIAPAAARTGAIVFVYGLDGLLLQAASGTLERARLTEDFVVMAVAAFERLVGTTTD